MTLGRKNAAKKTKSLEEQKRIIQAYINKIVVFKDKIVDFDGHIVRKEFSQKQAFV